MVWVGQQYSGRLCRQLLKSFFGKNLASWAVTTLFIELLWFILTWREWRGTHRVILDCYHVKAKNTDIKGWQMCYCSSMSFFSHFKLDIDQLWVYLDVDWPSWSMKWKLHTSKIVVFFPSAISFSFSHLCNDGCIYVVAVLFVDCVSTRKGIREFLFCICSICASVRAWWYKL